MRLFLFAGIVGLFLVGCDSGHTYAPVTEVHTIQSIPKKGSHRVVKGETLYEIAWRYGLDYRTVASHNQISAPYAIMPGQVLSLTRPAVHAPSKLTSASPSLPIKQEAIEVEVHPAGAKWLWPAKGHITRAFSSSNKGINIAGRLGQPIYAAAAGKVVYCGNGLRGYGNLIILKHNSVYLSAYAHNRTIYVREGDNVKQGQKIAEMGNTGSDKVMLHFEIRRAGKPVDPLSLYRFKL
jgi:lipoprotein NlpD